jgi:hypothetical protein
MNRQDRITRLVARKLQAARKDKNVCFARKAFCICMAGTATTPQQTPAASRTN